MPAKLKPSSKVYERDSRGRMTNKWMWQHFTPSSTSTKELKKMFEAPSFKKKKNIIKKELLKRNEII
jgi:hypothetical protein